ncbi:MAG: indole-3-glycerol phosphate synthase TrpC [Mangrovibacterium sp.]
MTILDEINANKRKEIAEAKKRISMEALRDFELFTRATNSLKRALRKPGANGIIAEFKIKSPSKGTINNEAEVTTVTSGYVSAGVSGLSVLTDNRFFGGSLNDLGKARKANPLTPILRKDFMLDPYQIYEAKAYGADLILLIAASLEKDEMLELGGTAKELEMEVLAEVHTEEELDKLNQFVDIVGVNNRNLKTFQVDVETSVRLGRLLSPGFIRISESGLSTAENINYLRKAGFEGFLVGENFMKSTDPAKACKEFIEQLGA